MPKAFLAVLGLTLGACSGGAAKTSSTSAAATSGGSASGGASTGASGASSGSGSGTSGSASGSSTGGGITADNFNQLLNSAECEFTLNCAGGAPYLDAICADIQQFVDLQDLPLAVDGGRVVLNLAKASACLSDFASGTCNQTLADAACQEAIVGNVPAAGACYDPSDCQSDGCAGNDPKACTPGTCQAVVELGGACGCPSCAACDPSSNLVCFAGSCAKLQGPEEACGPIDPPCEPALACVGGTCVTLPVPPTATCTFGQGQCQAGNYCFQDGSSAAGSCTSQVAAGGPCNEDLAHAENAFSFVDNECAGAHAVCAGAGWLLDGGPNPGVCAALSDVGGSCSSPESDLDAGASYNDGCFAGLNCIDGGCRRPPSIGPCAAGPSACDETVSFCASATGTCQAYIPLGGACNGVDPMPCGLEATCVNGTCATTQGCSPNL